MSMDDLIGTEEAAAILGVSTDHVSYLAQSGKLAATKISRAWVFRRGDVERFERKPAGRPKSDDAPRRKKKS